MHHLVSDCLLCRVVFGLDIESHSHSQEKVQFFETRLRIIVLAQILNEADRRGLQANCRGLTIILEKRCNFSRRDWELFFLLSPGETRSRLSYDHSRISRRERDSILLLSCFETRSRLQKIISRGRARKNEDESRREFPGSRILADLWFGYTQDIWSHTWYLVTPRINLGPIKIFGHKQDIWQ